MSKRISRDLVPGTSSMMAPAAIGRAQIDGWIQQIVMPCRWNCVQLHGSPRKTMHIVFQDSDRWHPGCFRQSRKKTGMQTPGKWYWRSYGAFHRKKASLYRNGLVLWSLTWNTRLVLRPVWSEASKNVEHIHPEKSVGVSWVVQAGRLHMLEQIYTVHPGVYR